MQEPDEPFTSDGCSGGLTAIWQFLTGERPPWDDCCIWHDKQYWQGGTEHQRAAADRILYLCVLKKGYPSWARLMWIAVRMFGGPQFNFRWSWGYGWRVRQGYKPRVDRKRKEHFHHGQ